MTECLNKELTREDPLCLLDIGYYLVFGYW